MAKILESYPVITEEAIELINPIVDISLFYTKENELKKLPITRVPDADNGYYIDDNGDWNPVDNNLLCKGKIILNELDCLFDLHKVALNSTTLGVALTLVSKTSKFNLTKSIGEFGLGDNNLSLDFDFEIDSKRLSQKIEIEIFIYAKSIEQESLYSSIEGSILGMISQITMDIEGSGSIFPIKIIDDSSKPLWSMNLNYDTLDDEFSIQTVCIKINKAHKDFKYLGSEDIDETNYYLWKEILSNFFINILLYSKEDYDSLLENSYEDGTIGCFISYLINSFKFEKTALENPIILSENIRSILDRIIK